MKRRTLQNIGGLLIPVVVAAIISQWFTLGLDVLVNVAAMRLSPEDKQQQLTSCQYFVNRAGDKGTAVQDMVAFWGAVGAAVEAMRAHPGDSGVQAVCGHALESIALFNRPTSIRVAQDGGIHTVTAALARFPMERQVQMLTGCLSSFNDLVPENRPIILSAGGIELIKKAMHNFYNDPEVLFRTGCAISATTGDAGVAEALAADGGIEFLMQMMRDHLTSYRVGQEIMQATRNMMHIDVKYREALLASGFMQAALDTIRSEMHERGTPTIGSTNMGMLAYRNKTMQDQLMSGGFVNLSLTAMRRYAQVDTSGYGGVTTSDVWPLIPSNLQALWCMTTDNPAVQAQVFEQGGLEQVLQVARVYESDYRAFLNACALLGNMWRDNETYREVVQKHPIYTKCPAQVTQGGPEPQYLTDMIGRM